MSYLLEMCHIGLSGKGDSTLILVKNKGKLEKTVLVDCGYSEKDGVIIQNIILTHARKPLDILVITHYDLDHINGAPYILENCCDENTVIIDYAFKEEDFKFAESKGLSKKGRHISKFYENKSDIEKCLLNKEILWLDKNKEGNAIFNKSVPNGAPSMHCIATNGWVSSKQSAPLIDYKSNNEESIKNQRSLGFLIKHGNFSYYIAGDLESPQENALLWLRGQSNISTESCFQDISKKCLNLAGAICDLTKDFSENNLNDVIDFIKQKYDTIKRLINKIVEYVEILWVANLLLFRHPDTTNSDSSKDHLIDYIISSKAEYKSIIDLFDAFCGMIACISLDNGEIAEKRFKLYLSKIIPNIKCFSQTINNFIKNTWIIDSNYQKQFYDLVINKYAKDYIELPKQLSALKLSHHGSKHSSSQYFLNQLKPIRAFISNGPQNDHGHPHQEVVDRIETVGTVCYYISGESNLVEKSKVSAVLNPNLVQIARDVGCRDCWLNGEKHTAICNVETNGDYKVELWETNFLGKKIPKESFCYTCQKQPNEDCGING